MPYVLRERSTGEIAAAMQKNQYNFDYYGVYWWSEEEEAEANRDAILTAGDDERHTAWDIIRVDENKVKLMNVKLKNNPAYRVVMDREGRLNAGLR